PRRHPLHEPLGQEQIEDEHRQRRDHEPGGQHADVLVLVGDEELDGQRQRADLLLGDEDDRIEELVPEVDEVQDHRGGHRGQRHREHDAAERRPVAAAIDARGFFQLGGDLGEERAQQVDRQRELGDDVDEREASEGVEEPVLHQDLEERQQHDLRREQDRQEKQQEERLAAAGGGTAGGRGGDAQAGE